LNAMYNAVIGSNNIAIGNWTSAGNYGGSNNVIIGHEMDRHGGGSNTLKIGGLTTGVSKPLIYGEFDNEILRANGEFQIGNPTIDGYAFPTIDGTPNQLLSTDGNGQISFINNPNPAAFSLARIIMNTSQSITSTGYHKINFNTVDFDINSDFDTVNDEFVAPADGYYRINANFRAYSIATNSAIYGLAIYVNNSRVRLNRYQNPDHGTFTRTINQVIELNENDTVTIRAYNSSSFNITSATAETSLEIERIR